VQLASCVSKGDRGLQLYQATIAVLVPYMTINTMQCVILTYWVGQQ